MRRIPTFILAGAASAAFVHVVAAGAQTGAPRVGPAHGTVIVVGGGAMGPEIYSRFIAAAGGPNALIVDVPTAGGDSVYGQNAPGVAGWVHAGAKHVVVIHTTSRAVANTDSFPSILAKAGGVWFEGGRQFHLVDAYAGTKTEQAFHDVLARGGVIGGSSAGASILGDFLVRGAPSNDNFIMDAPTYEKGFAFLRGVGIDQHVVARERLADLADSIMPRHPELLGMSEDEGTAWVVRGDTAEIVGRDKAFAYGGGATDPGKPFLTLYPGDRYDLGARRVLHRAADETAVSGAFIDSIFKNAFASGHAATVLVAERGHVFVDRAYGVPDQPKFMPPTTLPQFDLGGISQAYRALAEQIAAHGPAGQAIDRTFWTRRVFTPVGLHRTTVDSAGEVRSDVDEMYRVALGLSAPDVFVRQAAGDDGGAAAVDLTRDWTHDTHDGASRVSAYAAPDGRRAAFVRYPAEDATIIVLTEDPAFDARGAADRIADRLLGARTGAR